MLDPLVIDEGDLVTVPKRKLIIKLEISNERRDFTSIKARESKLILTAAIN